MTATRRAVWSVAALTVLGAAVRFSTLDVQSYWVDEAVTVHLMHHSLGGLLSAIPDSESTPPLYYLVAWVWAKVFGTGEAGLRSLSALAGTATVPVAYLAGMRLVSRRTGLVLAALTAVNPLLVWFSQEARAYALLALLCAATLAVLPRALEQPTRRSLGAWSVLSAFALGTHYFAIFVIAPQALLLARRLRRGSIPALAGVGLAGLALLPLAIHQAGNDRADFIRAISLAKRIVQVPKQFLVGFDAPLEALSTLAAVGLAAYAIWLLTRYGDVRERRGARTAAVIAGVAVGVPVVLSVVGIDYLITRNLIGAWVPVMAVVAAGLGVRAAPRAGAIATAALCVVMLAVLVAVEANPTYQRSDWRGAAKTLDPIGPRGRAFVITPPAGSEALGLYVPRLQTIPPGGAGFVSDVVVVATAERLPGQTPRPPRPPFAPPPPPGFRRAAMTFGKTYTVARYEPVGQFGWVNTALLTSLQLARGGADFRYEAPAR